MTGEHRLDFARAVDDWLRTLTAAKVRPRTIDAYRRTLHAAIDLLGDDVDPRTLVLEDYELPVGASHVFIFDPATSVAHLVDGEIVGELPAEVSVTSRPTDDGEEFVVRVVFDFGGEYRAVLSSAAGDYADAIDAAIREDADDQDVELLAPAEDFAA